MQFEKAKQKMGGTQYLPYGKACNKKRFYLGRQVLVRRWYSRRRCLIGVLTGFRKVRLGNSIGRKVFLKSNSKAYDDTTLIAEIDSQLLNNTEFYLANSNRMPDEAMQDIV